MDNQLALVTGGAGFIGAELVSQLAQRGFRIRVVDSLIHGKRENLSELPGNQFELAVADIRDEASMASLFQGADLIFHLASMGVRHSQSSPIENHQVNASATLGLLKIARNAGIKRFVYISSSAVYGKPRQAPISEQHATFPTTVYGASKLAGEAYSRAFWETYRYPTVVVRPFTTYGPHCHTECEGNDVIPRFMLQCMSGGSVEVLREDSRTEDFTFVSDMAEGILATGLSADCVGQTINLGSGTETSVRELATTVAQVIGKPDAEITHIQPHECDVSPVLADTRRAENILGFRPTVTLRAGLSRLHDWYISQGKTVEELLDQDVARSRESRRVSSHA